MGLKEAGLRGSLRNVSVGVGKPDSEGLQGWFDATELPLSDGDSVSTWTDESGNGNDLSPAGASEPTFRTAQVNGNAVVRFADGVEDPLYTSFTAEAEPNELYLIVNNPGSNEAAFTGTGSSGGSQHQLRIEQSSNSDAIFNGNQSVNASESGVNSLSLYTIIWDSTDIIRRNGTQVGSGDAGTLDADGILLGAQWATGGSNLGSLLGGDICEVLWYNQTKSGVRGDTEQYLADKWGITL